MATYDSRTDKITGCKKGTLVYYHELGHRDWYKKGIEQEYDVLFLLFLVLSVMFSANQFWMAAIISSDLMLLFYILPEAHAWGYAFRMKKEKDRR